MIALAYGVIAEALGLSDIAGDQPLTVSRHFGRGRQKAVDLVSHDAPPENTPRNVP
jgi:hypothetical protein